MTPYALILAIILIITPFAIGLAQKQDKGTKSRLKHLFLFILIAQIALGLPNWKALSLFLLISLVQIFLLTRKISHQTLVVILNFINTAIFFFTMIKIDQNQISDPNNLASIAIAFIVLIGNVIGLLLINKNKRLMLPKPLSRRGKLIFSLILALVIAAVIGFSFWNKNAKNTAITNDF